MTDQRRSLRARLAGWMVVSTLITLVLFAGAVFVALRIEEAEEPDVTETAEEPLTEEASEQVLVAMLLAGPLAMLVATAGALGLSRRALRPLHEVIGTVHHTTLTDLSRRLPLPERVDELHDLTTEVNALLGRLEEGFGALGRYAADASHELRTPLAVVTSRLEVAIRKPRSAEELTRTIEESLVDLRRLSQLVESLLELARAEGPSSEEASVDLRERMDLALARFVEPARERGIALVPAAAGDDASAVVRGDPNAIDTALRNVIDNAVRYTPAGGQVAASVYIRDGGVDAVIDDSGPGIESGGARAESSRRCGGGARRRRPKVRRGMASASRSCRASFIATAVRAPSSGARRAGRA